MTTTTVVTTAAIMIVVFRLLALPGVLMEFADGGTGNTVVGAVARLAFDPVAAVRVTSFELFEASSPPVGLPIIWVRAVSMLGVDERSSCTSNSNRFCNCFRSANSSAAD